MSFTKKLLLIDASSFIYRAFHAFPPLTNKDGEPVGAIFGFLTLLRALLKREKPDSCLLAFDPKGGSSSRKNLFEAYKAHRSEMPPLLKIQIQQIVLLLKASGLKTYVAENFEADDLIASMVSQFQSPEILMIIASADKDMAQLVQDPNIRLLQDKERAALDVERVYEKYGVYPHQIPDYLALLGDASDNIPGIKGIGKKSAEQLLGHFESLEDIFARPDHFHSLTIRGKEKIQKLLKEGEEMGKLSKRLATLHRDIPLPFDIEECAIRSPQFPELIAQLERLEFHLFLKEARDGIFAGRFFNPQQSESVRLPESLSEPEFYSVQQIKPEAFFLNMAQERDVPSLPIVIVFDTASTPHRVGLLHNKRFTALPIQELETKGRSFSKTWQQCLVSKNILKIGDSARGLYRQWEELCFASDLSHPQHLLSALESKKSNSEIWKRFFHNKELILCDDAGDQRPVSDWDPLCYEAVQLLLSYELLINQLSTSAPKLITILNEIEIPLIGTLHRMEQAGIQLNRERLQQLDRIFQQEAHELESQVHLLSGQEFNLSSSKQVEQVLFDELALPSKVKTKKGKRSSCEEALAGLAANHPIAALLLKYREVSKLRSTYTQGLLREISTETGRVHTHYQQLVTSTGRLSSTHPNLQNIPIKSRAGREIRRCFVAPPGYVLVSADYSQVELRILAHFSQDPELINSFHQAEDVHRTMAAHLFSKSVGEITPQERRRAKTILFGLIYGMSAFGLSRELRIPRREAQTYLEQYFLRYPGVKNYLNQTREQVTQQGWVETFLGRRWFAPKLKNLRMTSQDANLRAAINAPIQGTAAELIKVAMIQIDDWIRSLGQDPGIRMLLQVHDELLFEVKGERITLYQGHIKAIMEQALKLSVPLVVNIGTGSNWTEAH